MKKAKIAFFDAKQYDITNFDGMKEQYPVEITYIPENLNKDTASAAEGHDVICPFVNDSVDADVLNTLHRCGVKLVALRSAGFNHVDLKKANELGIKVVRVPAYSPYAVAEFIVGLLLNAVRKIHRSYTRTSCGDFSLSHGLLGYDLKGRTVGIIGAGRIGQLLIERLHAFEMNVLVVDAYKNEELASKERITYVELDEMFKNSDIICPMCPLFPETHHIIREENIKKMKKGVIIVNGSRGGLINTNDLLEGLENGHIAGAALDVYENESGYFFEDWSETVIPDHTLTRLMTLPNVLLTAHQAFFTEEAIGAIAEVTLGNVKQFIEGTELTNEVKYTAE